MPGSPPPMRGKGLSALMIRTEYRITPAYAGKRDFPTVPIFIFGDHPRLCGEKVIADIKLTGGLGSPPPMRGKAQSDIANNSTKGITPAYAGKREACKRG